MLRFCVGGQKHYRHLEKSHLLSWCGIVYKVIRWSISELKRDFLYLTVRQ